MRRKIIFSFFLLLLLILAGWAGWLWRENFNAAVFIAKVESEFPLVPLPEPSDPNGFEAAAQAFDELCKKEKPFPCQNEEFRLTPQAEFDRVYALAFDIPMRMKGYVPEKHLIDMDLGCYSPLSRIFGVFRFYAHVQKTALKTGDRSLFIRGMHDSECVFEFAHAPVFSTDFWVESVWFLGIYDFYTNLGAFPKTTIAELEGVLKALPPDDFFVQRLLPTLKNDYRHEFLPKLAEAEKNNLEALRTKKVFWCDAPDWKYAPPFLFYSRSRTQAQYLRFLSIAERAIPLRAEERTFVPDWDLRNFPPAHWLLGNAAGGVFNGITISGLLPSLADPIRDSTNLRRLGIAAQIFYRRHGRQIASLDELVSDGILPLLPVHYSEGESFMLTTHNNETLIAVDIGRRRPAVRLIAPNPVAGSLILEDLKELL